MEFIGILIALVIRAVPSKMYTGGERTKIGPLHAPFISFSLHHCLPYLNHSQTPTPQFELPPYILKWNIPQKRKIIFSILADAKDARCKRLIIYVGFSYSDRSTLRFALSVSCNKLLVTIVNLGRTTWPGIVTLNKFLISMHQQE